MRLLIFFSVVLAFSYSFCSALICGFSYTSYSYKKGGQWLRQIVDDGKVCRMVFNTGYDSCPTSITNAKPITAKSEEIRCVTVGNDVICECNTDYCNIRISDFLQKLNETNKPSYDKCGEELKNSPDHSKDFVQDKLRKCGSEYDIFSGTWKEKISITQKDGLGCEIQISAKGIFGACNIDVMPMTARQSYYESKDKCEEHNKDGNIYIKCECFTDFCNLNLEHYINYAKPKFPEFQQCNWTPIPSAVQEQIAALSPKSSPGNNDPNPKAPGGDGGTPISGPAAPNSGGDGGAQSSDSSSLLLFVCFYFVLLAIL